MYILVFKEIGKRKKESSHEIFSLMEKRPHMNPFCWTRVQSYSKAGDGSDVEVGVQERFGDSSFTAGSRGGEASADSDYLSFFLFNGRHLSN